MTNNYKNVGMIYQPHFMTNCFRVSCKSQEGDKHNYIVVTCSPEFNGVWKYDASKTTEFDIWKNGRLSCYCVPINVCTRVKKLEELKNEEMIKEVKKQQQKWFNSEVRNRTYTYKNKPDWMEQ